MIPGIIHPRDGEMGGKGKRERERVGKDTRDLSSFSCRLYCRERERGRSFAMNQN